MKQSKIRFAYQEEMPTVKQWLEANPAGDFDQDILGYPTLKVICCYREQPDTYLPVHQAMIMETVGFRKELGLLDRAASVRDLTKASELIASSLGIREIYFLGGAEGMGELAMRQAGFEKLDTPVYRLKLK